MPLRGMLPNSMEECKSLVITPHPGEMARLTGLTIASIQRDRINVARTFAREHNLIVVLKGHRTLVARARRRNLGKHYRKSRHGNRRYGRHPHWHGRRPAGAKSQARTGSRNCRGLSPWARGRRGAGAMGEHSLVATDLLQGLPEAFRRVRQAAQNAAVEFSS